MGRTVGIPDVFDALTSKRSYKDPCPVEVALDVFGKERGEHFNPGRKGFVFHRAGAEIGEKDQLWMEIS